MPKTTKTPAEVKYAEVAADIKTEIADLQKALKKHKARFAKKPRDWGFAGDLGRVWRNLREAVNAL